MSYLLDFPKTPLPHNARSPPYVIFGINGIDVASTLPLQIPLNAVIHFVPKLKQFVLPAPAISSLPRHIARLALLKPCVGIDIILEGVDKIGLEWIVLRILQLCGVAPSSSLFKIQPGLISCVSIHKTWQALELPPAGIANLYTRIQFRLMLGPAVKLHEMEGLWGTFGDQSDITREMALNFIRFHGNKEYTRSESIEIQDWYLQNGTRRHYFKNLEDALPKAMATQEAMTGNKEPEVKKEKKDNKKKSEATGTATLTATREPPKSRVIYRANRKRGTSLDRPESTTSVKNTSSHPDTDKTPESAFNDDAATANKTAENEMMVKASVPPTLLIRQEQSTGDKHAGSTGLGTNGRATKHATFRKSSGREELLAAKLRQWETGE
ncbi:hypothetical protein ACN47E_001012 [Coniothyrium glycines]